MSKLIYNFSRTFWGLAHSPWTTLTIVAFDLIGCYFSS